MKKFALILATILITGCATNKKISQKELFECLVTKKLSDTYTVVGKKKSYEYRMIYSLNHTNSSAEDPNNPGTFYPVDDTIWIQVTHTFSTKGKGFEKTTYKILDKY